MYLAAFSVSGTPVRAVAQACTFQRSVKVPYLWSAYKFERRKDADWRWKQRRVAFNESIIHSARGQHATLFFFRCFAVAPAADRVRPVNPGRRSGRRHPIPLMQSALKFTRPFSMVGNLSNFQLLPSFFVDFFEPIFVYRFGEGIWQIEQIESLMDEVLQGRARRVMWLMKLASGCCWCAFRHTWVSIKNTSRGFEEVWYVRKGGHGKCTGAVDDDESVACQRFTQHTVIYNVTTRERTIRVEQAS